MLEAFLSESRDNLETASKCFLALETNPNDKEIMDELFRAVHTIKGSSGLFDILPFTQVVHVAEDILDNARDGALTLDSGHIDIFLDAFDQVNAWLDNLEDEQVLPEDAAIFSSKLTSSLNQIMPGEMETASVETKPEISTSVKHDENRYGEAPTWLNTVPKAKKEAALEKLDDNLTLFAVRYQPDATCFFSGDDPLHFVCETPGLQWFSTSPVSPWSELIELDPFSANLVFHILSVCDKDALLNHLRYLPEQVDIIALSPDSLGSQPEHKTTNTSESDELSTVVSSDNDIEVLCALLESQIDMLKLTPSDAPDGRVESVKRILINALPSSIKNMISNDHEFTTYLGELEQANLVAAIQSAIAAVKNGPSDANTQAKQSAATPPPLTNAPDLIADSQQPMAQETGAAKEEKSQANKVLRVDQQRIDAIMDLVGELVVAKNALPYLAKRAEEEFGVRPLAKEIKSQYAAINRLSDELQSAVMQIGMVPMSTVFQRFPRLVRDLARKLDKKIKLVLEGEDTEADKNVVEELADPLIHLIRNSLDHGLEMPSERVAAGKPEQGTITLKAIPKDDQVIIEVSDDGKGIDPSIIKRKAYEKGVIDEEKLENISDQEALQLIFAAGFSTAEQVSDLSGRGVGMDVVRTVIQQSGGSVIALSEVGKGSTMRLTLPLSMAVTRVMMLEVGAQLYGISMDNIVETVRVPIADVQGIKQQKAIVLRDRLIPLFDLRHLLEVENKQDKEELAVLVMHHGEEEIGLVIDEFHEGIDIIQKPLEGVMAGFSFYSGTALLGDGKVLLVLNIPELIACQ